MCHSEKDQLGVGVTVEEMKAHMELKRSINCGKLSASLGMLINLGEMFEERPSTTLVKEYLPSMKGKLKGQYVKWCYNIALSCGLHKRCDYCLCLCLPLYPICSNLFTT